MTSGLLRACGLLAVLSAATGAGAQTATFERFSYAGRTLEQASAQPGQYLNPIVEGYYPDPSILRVGADYYLVNSSFAFYPGLPVFHSKDMVNWTQIGNAIDRPDQMNFSGRGTSQALFAPDISYHAGTFYIVNTCVECGGNFVITAKDPAGPWSAPIMLPFEGIDPSLYWEGDRAYIVNNRAPAEPPRYEGHRALWLQEYDWRAGKMVGESTQLVDAGVDPAAKPAWIEGPHLFKRGAYYYLMAAEGGTSDNHSEVVFRATALRGPYLPYAGNPILTQRDLPPGRPTPITSAGHAELIETQRGDWWATFLAIRPYAPGLSNIGRETFLLPVTWRDGWPVILPHQTAIPFAAAKPNLPPQPRPALPTSGDFAYTDTFAGTKLGLGWIGVRIPATPFARVERGALRLTAAAPLGDVAGTPAFIGRRQQHAVATVTTVMRFVPDADGARAGLAALQSDQSYLFFGVTRIAGKPMVAVYTRAKTPQEQLVASAPIDPRGPVTLTLRITGGTAGFDYVTAAGKRTLADGVDATLLSTERAGGFVGTVIGPYVGRR